MSTAALPGTFGLEGGQNHHGAERTSNGRLPGKPALRRPGSLEQGYALEALGHAVEYLVDSRLFATNDAEAKSDQEAIQVLMRMSREVFAECPEVEPLRKRLSRWLVSRRTPSRHNSSLQDGR